MTALLALLAQFWQPIAGGVLAGLGVLYAVFVKKGATADVATARQSEAEAHVKVAQLSQGVAEANAKAADSTAQAAQERTNVQNDVSTLPAGAAADELRNDWAGPGS